MTVQEIRNKSGQLIGRIESGGSETLELRDHSGTLLFTYNASANETRDARGSLVGHGNLLASLA